MVESQPTSLWDEEQFARDGDGDFWRLGTGSFMEEGTITIAPDAALLDRAYGNSAASRIVRTEAELSLVTWNPPLLAEDAVYFGVLLQSADDPNLSAGLQVNLVDLGIIRLSAREGESVTQRNERSDPAANLRIRLERNLDTQEMTVYVNNQQLGIPISFPAGDGPVVPVLFVHSGGVIVHVHSWSLTLS